jgi:hypothetical protein
MLAYGRRLRGELGEEEMKKAAKAWSIWEGRTSNLIQVRVRVSDRVRVRVWVRVEEGSQSLVNLGGQNL